MKFEDVKVGMKVVPFKKSIGNPNEENKTKENKMKIKQNFTINTNKAYYIGDSEYNKKDIINLLKYCGYRCITELFENPISTYRSDLLFPFYGANLLDSKGAINYNGKNLDGKLVLAISDVYNHYALFKVEDVQEAIEKEHNKLKAKESTFKVDDLVFVETNDIDDCIGVITNVGKFYCTVLTSKNEYDYAFNCLTKLPNLYDHEYDLDDLVMINPKYKNNYDIKGNFLISSFDYFSDGVYIEEILDIKGIKSVHIHIKHLIPVADYQNTTIRFDSNKTLATLTHKYKKDTVGHATLDTKDKYNMNTGIALASIRAAFK